MNTFRTPFLYFFLVLVAALGPLRPSAQAVTREEGTITVTGEASTSVVPDRVVLHLGAEATADTLGAASAPVAEAVKAAVAKWREAGIAATDIQTSRLNIQLVQRPYSRSGSTSSDNPRPQVQVSTDLRIVLRDTAQLDAVLRAGLSSGLNRVHGLAFESSAAEAMAADLRDQALLNARAKADRMSKVLGDRVYRVLTIEETGGAGFPIMGRTMASATAGGPEVPQVMPGEITITAGVRVVFALQGTNP